MEREDETVELTKHPATYTCEDSEVGHLWYFAPAKRAKPPYLHQVEVKAIVDIAHDGTLAGVEIIDGDFPPPK